MHIRFLLLAATAAIAIAAHGADIIIKTITGSAGNVYPFSIDIGGDGGAAVAAVVRNDLTRHGAFAEAKNTTYLVGRGTAAAGGTEATFQLFQNSQSLLSKRYKGPAARRLGHQIADDIVGAVLKEKGFFTTRLLYVKNTGTARNIFMCDSDGYNVRPLTRSATLCVFPDWYPDGVNALFTGYMEGRPILYKLNLSSGGSSQLLALPGMNTSGAISPNGQSLAAILDKDGLPELYVVDLQTKKRTRLTRSRNAESSPSWSPDSRQIVYSCEEVGGRPQIYVIAASGGEPKRITSSSLSRYCVSPAWSPDGKKIAFVADCGGNFEICMYDIESRQTYRLTNDPSNDEGPSWARDSRHIAFSRGGYSGTRIMMVDSETAKAVPLISEGNVLQPAWQP